MLAIFNLCDRQEFLTHSGNAIAFQNGKSSQSSLLSIFGLCSSGNSTTPAINFQQGSPSPLQSSGRQGILKLTVTKQ
ncbi:MAG TPA: hypothetical protein DDW76_25930 [Cyanobacteria bacterium UBA11369]|nr:hypothetical protein [Cyanobacteria bacterium UBA11371]HBE31413.1 hypothetical protein [Cyanobacteria bacterium UBA11368]HBE52115.1 hypothetical protein [Cyanobacteria bacterium UBA11369]